MDSASITEPVGCFTDVSQLQKLKTSYIYHRGSTGRGLALSTEASMQTVRISIFTCRQNENSANRIFGD